MFVLTLQLLQSMTEKDQQIHWLYILTGKGFDHLNGFLEASDILIPTELFKPAPALNLLALLPDLMNGIVIEYLL